MQLSDYLASFDPQRRLATRNRVVFDTIDSTNRVGRQIASAYLDAGASPPSTLVLALEQSAGRGRLGRSWASPRGGVYASLIVPERQPARFAQLPMLAAVALCREVDRVIEAPCRIKWPNDLIVDGRKIGGVLIESVGRGARAAAVIGFGVNYSADLGELTPTATNIVEHCRSAPSLPGLAFRLVDALEQELARSTSAHDAAAGFARWSLHRRGETIFCRIGRETVSGAFGGFDAHGFLRLVTAEGVRRVSGGEVVEIVREGRT